MIVDIEYSTRKSNSLKRLICNAGFDQPEAYIDDIITHPVASLTGNESNVWQVVNTLQSIGTSSLPGLLEVVNPTWHVPSAWRPANSATKPNMSDFRIFLWNWIWPETMAHTRRCRRNMPTRFCSSLMNGCFSDLRNQSSTIFWNCFTEGGEIHRPSSVRSMILTDGMISLAGMKVLWLKPSLIGSSMMPTESASFLPIHQITNQCVRYMDLILH